MSFRALLRQLWRPLRSVLLPLAALVLAFEEWGWRPLVAWAAQVARWPPLARLEDRLRRAPPAWALVSFLAPSLLLFPVKLLALWLIHLGHAAAGVLVIVLAKLLGTAVIGRIFVVTEPQLMQLAWFARAVGWWRATKERVRTALAASSAWRACKARAADWRESVRRWWHPAADPGNDR